MKNNLKKGLVSAALAGSMMVALPGAAFAATAGDQTLVNKTWTAASASQLNNTETFQFELTFKGSTPQGSYKPTDFSDFGTKTVNLTSAWLANANGASSSASLTAAELFDGTDFTQPGTYTFHLKEKKGDNPNISYDSAEYDVVVVVAMPDSYPANTTPEIKSIKAHATNGTKTDAANFNNTAAANDSLTVSKTVSGAAANTNDEFTYTLTLEGAQDSYDFVKSDGTTGTIKSGDTFKLKHDQTIEIKNLPEGASYKVVETDTTYDETVTVNGKAQADGHVAEGTVTSANSVSYLNKKGFAADTGITANSLPFVALAVVAAAGGATLIISRKRRASEEF